MFGPTEDIEQKTDTPSMPTEQETTTTPEPSITEIDPNAHLQQFLTDNGYELFVNALSERTPFLDKRGFIMTDKPLLVISAKKKN